MPFRTFCLIDKFWQNKCTCILKGLIIYLEHNILSYQYIFFLRIWYIPRNIPIFIFSLKEIGESHTLIHDGNGSSYSGIPKDCRLCHRWNFEVYCSGQGFWYQGLAGTPENHLFEEEKSSSKPSFFGSILTVYTFWARLPKKGKGKSGKCSVFGRVRSES